MNKVIGSTLMLSSIGLLIVVGLLVMSLIKEDYKQHLEVSVHLQDQITNVEKRIWRNEKIIKAYMIVKK